MVRQAYLEAAAITAELLADPAVAASWRASSALPEFTVSGLAGHLARQVSHVSEVLALDVPDEPPIELVDNYTRARWVGAGVRDEISVGIRRGGEEEAAAGPAALAEKVRSGIESLRTAVPAEPADRVVYLSWGPWSLRLDDFLVTRMLEIAVHCDDLAVSVGVETPAMPARVLDPVLELLTRLAVRRHGATAVLRAFSRAERAPGSVAVI